MLVPLGKLLLVGYLLLLSVAAGGLIGANIAGFAPVVHKAGASSGAPDAKLALAWMHRGWMVGAAVFPVVLTAKALRSRRRKKSRDETQAATTDGERSSRGSRRRGWQVHVGSRRYGVLGSIGVGGIFGGVLGAMVGASFLLLWFSLAYSPLAPAGWASSISIQRIQTWPAAPQKRAATTVHPLAFYAFGGPIILGAVASALLAGVATATEKRPT